MESISPVESLKRYTFKRQVLQLVPLRDLRWPRNRDLTSLECQEWLYSSLFDNDSVKYLPPVRYQLQVLKELLSRIEETVDSDQNVRMSLTGRLHISSPVK
jgi:hypothetical protein